MITHICLGHSHDHHHTVGKEGEHHHEEEEKEQKKMRFQSYAIISMIGDFTHNFTDGLAIGVAYMASNLLWALIFRFQDGHRDNSGHVPP